MFARRCISQYAPLLMLLFFVMQTADTWAQSYYDSPIELRMRVRDIRVEYQSNSSSDFNLSVGSLGLSNFEDDELTFKVWGRDNLAVSGGAWQGGNCLTDQMQMTNGGPDFSNDFNTVIFNYTYPTPYIPSDLDIAMEAWEDDVPTDFSIISGITPCGSTGSRCTFETNVCCLNLFGCVFDEGDDYLCDAGPFAAVQFKTFLDYRYDSTTNMRITPCFWYDHGYIEGDCPQRNYYRPRIETFYRYTQGFGCANAIDLGIFGASPIIHYNNNSCYNNNWPNSPGNDVTYSFTVNQPFGMNASLCGVDGAQFDSYLYFLDSNCAVQASNDNGCGNQSNISFYVCQPGTYYLVVDATAANELGTFTLEVTEDSSFLFRVSIDSTDVRCFGADDGIAVASALGGYPPYTFEWSHGPQTDSVGGLAPGVYTVTVTDSEGCTLEESTTINEPTALVSTTSAVNVSCSGAEDGTATVNPSGGTPPYNYIWGSQPMQVTQTAEFLSAGTYMVTVIDANNCLRIDSATVGTNTVITLTLDSLQHISCFGADDGAIDISVSGGVSPYDFDWSNGTGNEDQNNLAPGTYSVTIYDQDSCFIVDSFTILEPTLLVATIDDTVHVSCNGGSNGIITIDVVGGTPPYTYLWSNGRTNQDLLNVIAGTYTVTVYDDNACEAQVTHTINEPAAITAVWDITEPACFGDSTGSIDLTITGGTPPYTYLWTTNDSTEDLTNIPAGAYGVLVTDSFNCFLFEFNTLTTPAAVDLSLAGFTNALCNGDSSGTIDLNIAGGVPPYTFTWSNPLAAGQNATGLSAGTYYVTATDQVGCSDSLNVVISEPLDIVVQVLNVHNVTCNGFSNGGIEVDVTGGTQPYTYLWSTGQTSEDLVGIPAGTYSFTVTDANNCSEVVSSTVVSEPTQITSSLTKIDPSCPGATNGSIDLTVNGGTPPYTFNWSNGGNTEDINNIGSGNYAVVITDDQGCVHTDTITLRNIGAIEASAAITQPLCYGDGSGEIVLTVTGGTAPFSFTWSDGGSGDTRTNMPGGSYDVTISDANSCTATFSYFIDEPDSLALDLISTDVTCYGDADGVISPIVSGGTPGFTYQWSDGQTGVVAVGLNPGMYSMTITDSNGCTQVQDVMVNGPDQLIVAVTDLVDISCFDETDGRVSLTAAGGTAPYRYSVQNNNLQNDTLFTGLAAGSYTAIVFDDNNCQSTTTFTLAEPSDWEVDFAEPYVFVSRGATTTLTPIVPDTIIPSQYIWSPANGLSCTNCAEPEATPLETTNYSVTVIDQNGCESEGLISVVVKNAYEVFLPNAFSPNGDGLNDIWAPIDFGSVQEIDIKIFDRWGSLVFQSSSVANGWDGTCKGSELAPETYVYQIQGTFLNDEEFDEVGSILLLR